MDEPILNPEELTHMHWIILLALLGGVDINPDLVDTEAIDEVNQNG